MDTGNIVMSMILCAIIGFAIGNVWGKETMKRTFHEIIKTIMSSIDKVVTESKDKKEETK